VLSAGHASLLQYATLHLAGYDLRLDELAAFRQLGSRTPGHPERGVTPGIEVGTGPLGQGISMAVGLALGERLLADRFNRDGHGIVDHRTYVIAGDGDMMEGITSEATSLAGTLGLDRLTVLYDDNHISIEGSTDLAFCEDVVRRFQAHDWHVVKVDDANDLPALAAALDEARAEHLRPTLIVVRSHIGYGSPKQDDASAHGAPLGAEALAATREQLGWSYGPFEIPRTSTSTGTPRWRNDVRHTSVGRPRSNATATITPRWPTSTSGAWQAGCPKAGRTSSPPRSPRTGRSRPVAPSDRRSTPPQHASRSWWEAAPISPRPPPPTSTARATSAVGDGGAATCTSGSASTPWVRC
jgi:transketolase N-terminal domain/subunit